MDRTLTILAGPPEEIQNPAPDGVIDETLARLEQRTDKENHRLVRAASVRQVREHLSENQAWLTEDNSRPALIQMIGHGASGMLWLGANWADRYASRDRLSVYILDSDPNNYGVLGFVKLKPNCKVWLLGCNSGADDKRTGYEMADGPTLLFDLMRMWGIDVSGAGTLVMPEDFDKTTGVYKYEARLSTAHASSNGVTMATEQMPLQTIGDAREIELSNWLVPTAYAHWSTKERFAMTTSIASLLRRVNAREVKPSALLAAPETKCRVVLDGEEAPGDFIANLKLLRVQTSIGIRCFSLANEQRNLIVKAFRLALGR